MEKLTAARLIIAALAIVVWGYGTKMDNATLRIAGMALLAVALVLRFARLRRPNPPAPK